MMKQHSSGVDPEVNAATKRVVAAMQQDPQLVTAMAQIPEMSSQDGRYQLVTASVQLLLVRQKQQPGYAVSANDEEAAADAMAEALRHVLRKSEASSGAQSSLSPSQNVPESRPARPPSATPEQTQLTAQSTAPKDNSNSKPRLHPTPQQRSNASILALAHTLIAAHASPQLDNPEPKTQPSKKPPVPRVRRRPPRPQSAEESNSAAGCGSEAGEFECSPSYGRAALQPVSALQRMPASKRPAWAQLVHAAPAEQEQALLDWVASVSSTPAEVTSTAESGPETTKADNDSVTSANAVQHRPAKVEH